VAQEHTLSLRVNGEHLQKSVSVRSNLVDFLRDQLGLTGSHVGCEQGVCGACTVQVDGVMVRGCLLLAAQADGASVTTIEGFSELPTGKALQRAFVEHNALQCGFCTPGMLASAIGCRCTGYQAIVDAIVSVIEKSTPQ